MHNIAKKLGYVNPTTGQPKLRRLIKTKFNVKLKTLPEHLKTREGHLKPGEEYRAEMSMMPNRFGHLRDLTNYAKEATTGRQKQFTDEQLTKLLESPEHYRLRISKVNDISNPRPNDIFGNNGSQVLRTSEKGERVFIHLKDGSVLEVLGPKKKK